MGVFALGFSAWGWGIMGRSLPSTGTREAGHSGLPRLSEVWGDFIRQRVPQGRQV